SKLAVVSAVIFSGPDRGDASRPEWLDVLVPDGARPVSHWWWLDALSGNPGADSIGSIRWTWPRLGSRGRQSRHWDVCSAVAAQGHHRYANAACQHLRDPLDDQQPKSQHRRHYPAAITADIHPSSGWQIRSRSRPRGSPRAVRHTD